MEKEEKKKICEYIKDRGREVILQECDNNLRSVKNHLKRYCTSSNWGSVITQFREYLMSKLGYSQALRDEFLNIVKTYFGGLRNER